MPRLKKTTTKRFRVKEERGYTAEYLIEADDAESARQLRGAIIESDESRDSYGIRLISCEETDDTEL